MRTLATRLIDIFGENLLKFGKNIVGSTASMSVIPSCHSCMVCQRSSTYVRGHLDDPCMQAAG